MYKIEHLSHEKSVVHLWPLRNKSKLKMLVPFKLAFLTLSFFISHEEKLLVEHWGV